MTGWINLPKDIAKAKAFSCFRVFPRTSDSSDSPSPAETRHLKPEIRPSYFLRCIHTIAPVKSAEAGSTIMMNQNSN